jgi:hypothetical protein
MKRTTLITSILAAGILAAPALSLSAIDWDRIIDFNDYAVGDYHGPDGNPVHPDSIIVTRDEGWEGTQTGGSAVQRIRADENDNRYYMMHTLGRGVSWSHVFSLINFEEPMEGIGTIYWESVKVGPSSHFIVGVAANPAIQVSEGEEGWTPWGWTGMTTWGQTRTGTRKDELNVWWALDSAWRHATLDDPEIHLGVWYSIWHHINVPDNDYRMYIQGGQFTEPTIIPVTVDGVVYEDLFFRGAGTESIPSIFINTQHGHAGNPNQGDPWFLNNIAWVEGVHTLERPDANMALSPGVILPRKWGFSQITAEEEYRLDGLRFLGEFWGNYAPWLYSVDLGTWKYASVLTRVVEDEVVVQPETADRSRQDGSWNYVMNSGDGPGDVDANGNLESKNYMGWVNTTNAPWFYLWNIGTWAYLADGTLDGSGAWVWVTNADKDRE